MNSIKKQLPNFFTALNLFCGSLAIIAVINNQYYKVLILISISLISDFLDGFIARLLNVKSKIGKELDSLADVISFGLLPSFICISLLAEAISKNTFNITNLPNISILGFFIVIFAALRLAKFNIDNRQTDSFIGLNTPATTMFILGLWLFKHLEAENQIFSYFFDSPSFIVILIFCLCFLMVSELRFFSLKINSFNINKYPFQLTLIIGSIVLIFINQYAALSLIILLYLLLSIINNLTTK